MVYSLLNFKNKGVVLFDSETNVPCLFALRYYSDFLENKSNNYQRSQLQSISFFYNYWFDKFEETFDYSFHQSNFQDIDSIIQELDGFFEYLRNNRSFIPNLIRLPSENKTEKNFKKMTTNVQHYRSVGRFIEFLINTYISTYYIKSPINNVHKLHNALLLKLKHVISKHNMYMQKKTRTKKYKSLTREQLTAFLDVTKPSTSAKPNLKNPVMTLPIQYRNYLIIRIAIKYGLRIGEILLLRRTSFLPNLNGTSFYMRVDTLDDDQDTRTTRPSIKTNDSTRTLSIDANDYKLILEFFERIRSKECTHDFIFTSSRAPYKPLSYRTAWEIFLNYNNAFKKHYPHLFDNKSIDCIETVTPHVMRHTWAYHTFASFYHDITEDRTNYALSVDEPLEIRGVMEDAKAKLRELGGWSLNSDMPNHYAARFTEESANKLLLESWLHDLTNHADNYIFNME